MSSEKEILIFDLDGTILDTIDDIHSSLMNTLRYFNFPTFDISITKQYVGDGIKKLVERAVGEDNFKDEHERHFRAVYKENLVNQTKPFTSILNVLERLKDRYIMAILSNKSFEMTDYLVKHFKLDNYFVRWYGGDSFVEKKPSPLPIYEIIKITRSKKDGYLIGDNYTDVESGNRAGLKTIFCRYGYGKLYGQQPDYFVDTPEELLNILI
ncbi:MULTISPECIES: HAD family hydrolase [Calditerrivibrio]|uniref:phosphoglycolate phosphatase n=1 Tax=Calditerrivibrio nitroreducens TaxID=477976 RepID=A0A2J6WHZ3_9BACT|nr:MAG: phosphoglycolate phosphatase [Calditerrivibrio nitroreducens]